MKNKLICFSPTGEKLAHSTSDGILRIWNTASGVLEHEFKPAEHLSATTTCIRYSPMGTIKDSTKGEKRKSVDGSQNSLLAMGTLAGTVLLYSPEKREVIATLEHGSQHAILDVAWRSATKLFCLGENNILTEWDITTGDISASAEVDGGSSICAIQKNVLAVGYRNIKVVTLVKGTDKPKVKCEFTGHASSISQLLSIRGDDGSPRIILSAAEDDTYFYAWDMEKKTSEPVGSFMVKEPIGSVATSEMKGNTLMLSAITSKGVLALFRQHLNGNKNVKAIKATGSIKLYTKGKKKVIPILSCYFMNDSAASVIIAYGFSSILKFEKIDTREISGLTELIRTESSTAASRETALSKTVEPKVSDNVTVIAPRTLLAPGHLTSSETGKRKLDSDKESELPMEERLSTLALEAPTGKAAANAVPTGTNITKLLLQGLHSKDERILMSVFSHKDQQLINNTVQRLPVQAVVPLLEYLQTLILGKEAKQCPYVTWVRSVLYYHMSHLSTVPNRADLMRPFFSASAARLSTLAKVTQLRARLDLLLNHVTTRHQEAKEIDVDAMLVYRDESSDDESDDMLEGSESDDKWEELSDFGEINGHSDMESEGDSEMEVDSEAVKRPLEEDDGSGEEEIDDEDKDDNDSGEEETDDEDKDNDDSGEEETDDEAGVGVVGGEDDDDSDSEGGTDTE